MRDNSNTITYETTKTNKLNNGIPIKGFIIVEVNPSILVDDKN